MPLTLLLLLQELLETVPQDKAAAEAVFIDRDYNHVNNPPATLLRPCEQPSGDRQRRDREQCRGTVCDHTGGRGQKADRMMEKEAQRVTDRELKRVIERAIETSIEREADEGERSRCVDCELLRRCYHWSIICGLVSSLWDLVSISRA